MSNQTTNEPRPEPHVAPPPAPSTQSGDQISEIVGKFRPFLLTPLQITIEVGRAKVSIAELLEMTYHSVFELDKNTGNNLDIYVNNVLFGRGEVLVIEDRVGIKINEIVESYD